MILIIIAALLLFILLPLILTCAEFIYLLHANSKGPKNYEIMVDFITLILGFLYSILCLAVLNTVDFSGDWYVTLANAGKHTPIFTQSLPTVLVLAAVGMVGYLAVTVLPVNQTPPLLTVLAMSAMYLGTLESVIWGIQLFCLDSWTVLLLLLFPLNCVLITAKAVKYKVLTWKNDEARSYKLERVPFLGACNRFLRKSGYWPIAAFLFMWPLLGIIFIILLLFGQAPNSVIRAWTETSGWTLSKRIAPQNVYYDEHYLCTVAAGGHKRIVKPLRMGIRHGHKVVVNRQLCVANAFEQILEERTPRFHRLVRNFYDRYGFPLARLIRSRYTADIIYYLMKPLEWLFLFVLYLTEAHPEDRIALQYTGKSLKDFPEIL